MSNFIADIVSEEWVKTYCALYQNLDSKYLAPGIREAQRELEKVVGSTIAGKIDPTVTSGMWYELYVRMQPFVAYRAAAHAAQNTQFKVSNIGVVTLTDDKVKNDGEQSLARVVQYFNDMADGYLLDLQKYIIDNMSVYKDYMPEGDITRMKDALYSAASCGLWLGGERGYVWR